MWKKLGRIYDPELLASKGLSHAGMPIVEEVSPSGILRVYFSSRNQDNKSQLNSFDFDIINKTIVALHDTPYLTPGRKGTHDDSGVTGGSFCSVKGDKYFYYTGWNLTVSVPMNNSIGVAKYNSTKDVFERLGHGPIMTRNLHEPYSCASPSVIFDNEEGKFKMWYASMDEWKQIGDQNIHYYNIKYATSDDGVNWIRNNSVAINYENVSEYAFGRPFVIKENGSYKMWYAYRGDRYLIGYAESMDGIKWIRKDNLAGISPSEDGWDSEMIEYPYIYDFGGERYMFYNGNGYGKSGIGLAIFIK